MPIVNPSFKIRCPYCRTQFHPSDAEIVFLNGPNASNQSIKPPQPGSLRYLVSRFRVEELSGEAYTKGLAHRACPNCKRTLPEREIDETFNIAVVGDTYSGKTHYIAVLIDQLKNSIMTQVGYHSSRLIPIGVETEKKYREDYYNPILEVKNARLAGTQPGEYDASGAPLPIDPLVYQLSLSDNRTGLTKVINLLFYDISGEDVADNTKLVQFGEHILRADGIIYLADPLTMQRVRQILPAHLQPSAPPSRTAHEVLANVMYRFEQYQAIPPNGSINIPTAIIISKSDLLTYTLSVQDRRNYLIFQQKVYNGLAYPPEFARIHQEIEAFLRFYQERALLQLSKRFTNVNFLAASATGNAPDRSGFFVNINPLRCLDPFVWMLWKLGCIRAA